MGYSALRKGRHSEAGTIYVITTVTAGRRRMFQSSIACAALRDALRCVEDRKLLIHLAWVIMPDHIHLMSILGDSCGLSQAVNRVKTDSACRINQRSRSTGAFWEKGFYDHALRNDEDLLSQARYLIANPLRAGLVQRPQDYPHWFAIWAPPPFGLGASEGDVAELLVR